MKNWIKQSFKRELLTGFLGVSILPLVFSCLFLIHFFQMKADRDYQKITMEQVQAVNDAFSGLMDEIEKKSAGLTANSKIRDAVMQSGSFTNSEVYKILYQETSDLRELAQFDIYSLDGVCLYSTKSGMYQNTMPTYWGILKTAAAHGDELLLQKSRDSQSSQVYLQAVRAIPGEDGMPAGFFVADITEAGFEQIFHGICGNQDGLCILNEFLEPVYSYGTAVQTEIWDMLRTARMNGEPLPSSWSDNTISIAPLGATGLISVLLRPEIFTGSTITSMYTVLFLMTAFSCFLCLLVSSRLSVHLSHPILVLSRAMEQVQNGALDTRVHMERADEFGSLADSFDRMTKQLGQYMYEQVEQQKKLNEVQIAMMQAQLNPHFLYNTLDTMKWIAKANHVPELATLAAKLAKILRTSISSPPMVPLREEMELAASYAEIQRIRFGNRFSFSLELPEDLAGILVPKLIVQPLVENSMVHGLADTDNGMIAVRAYASADSSCLLIDVADNGSGISDETLERLNHQDQTGHAGHIGFYNVNMVIRLHYGDAYGLKAARRSEGGTCVTICIPAAAPYPVSK